MRALGLADAFDAVYLSSDCGCKKPDRRFFRLLLDEQRLDPARSIMVGNDPVCDAAGAREAGLDVLYVHSNLSPAGPLPEATFVLPEMDISRMGAILGRGSSAGLTGSARARQGRGVQHAVQLVIVHRQDIAGVQPFKGPRREVYFQMVLIKEDVLGVDGFGQPRLDVGVVPCGGGQGQPHFRLRLCEQAPHFQPLAGGPVKGRAVAQHFAGSRVYGLLHRRHQIDRLFAGGGGGGSLGHQPRLERLAPHRLIAVVAGLQQGGQVVPRPLPWYQAETAACTSSLRAA